MLDANKTAALAALRENGLLVDEIVWDAGFQRCGTADKPTSKNGTYSAHSDEPVCVWWHNWATDEKGTWIAKTSKPMTAKEKTALKRRIDADKAAHAKEQEAAAKRAQAEYDKATDCTGHVYLTFKGVKPCAGLKTNNNALIVPLYCEQGTIVSLQFIVENRDKDSDEPFRKRFLRYGRKRGSYFHIGDVDKEPEKAPLIICEGLATGLSLHECTNHYPVFVAFDAGNMSPVAELARRKYPDRKLVIAADNDIYDDGGPNVGLIAATKAAHAVDALLVVPSLKSGKKCDFNDVHQAEGQDAVWRQYEKVRPLEKPIDRMPPGFSFRTKGQQPGLYYKDEDNEILLAWPFEVLGRTRDANSANWGLLLRWPDRDGMIHRWAMPDTMLDDSSLWTKGLRYNGLPFIPSRTARKLLNLFFSSYETDRRARCVDRTGWHEDRTGRHKYVFPDATIKTSDKTSELNETEITVLQVENPANPFELGGSLDGWRNTIGTWAQGNSRLILALGASLAGVLLEPAGLESGGFNFVGASSIGKSTALDAAGSVWGKGTGSGGFVDSWRATTNGLEGLAALHSDALLALDELSQVKAVGLSEASYMLANGMGKARARQDGTTRAARNWRIMFLSTGEQGLAEKLAEDGYTAKAGQEVRLVDIPADAEAGNGLFENLHGHQAPGAFAAAIQKAAKTNYGHAARAFIQHVIDKRADVTSELQHLLTNGVSRLCPADADGQVKRVAKRFLLCSAACEKAVEWDLLPWKKGDAWVAVKKCFDAWIANRGGIDAAEDREIIAHWFRYLEQHGASRFQDTRHMDERCIDRVGCKHVAGDKITYYIPPESFRKEVFKGFDHKRVARVLCAADLLLRGDSKSYTRRPPKELPLNEFGRRRIYTLVYSVKNEGDGEENGLD